MRNPNITVREATPADRAVLDHTTGQPFFDESVTWIAEDRNGTRFGGTSASDAWQRAERYHSRGKVTLREAEAA